MNEIFTFFKNIWNKLLTIFKKKNSMKTQLDDIATNIKNLHIKIERISTLKLELKSVDTNSASEEIKEGKRTSVKFLISEEKNSLNKDVNSIMASLLTISSQISNL